MSSSSSSSSSSDSDDSILNAPTITKKNVRAAQRAEKAKMDFFDECLNGTNARADQQRRIAVVESEIMAESAAAEGEVMTETSVVKIKSENGTRDHNTDANSKLVSNEESSAVSTQVKQESEDSYWARVAQFTEKNSSVKPPDKKRRSDALSGLEYDSETDDEEGQWKDGGGMTRDQRRGEAAAKLTGGQSALGLRRVFGKISSNATQERKFYIFHSREEALDDLVSVVRTLNERKNSQLTTDKLLYQLFIRPLSMLLNKSKQIWGRGNHSMHRFLESNPILVREAQIQISCGCSPSCVILVPDLFVQWTWKLSCSSLGLTALESKCCKLLVKLIQDEPKNAKNQCGCDIERDCLKKFHMGDLKSCLVDDFGLWIGRGSPPEESESTNNNNPVGTDKANNSSEVDISSLNRLFMLWTFLLENDYALLDDAEFDSAVGEGATQDLVALARVTLDPHFELSTQRYKTCGDNTLLDVFQQLVTSLVESVARQITDKYDQKQVNDWLENTASSIIESCSTFSAGDDNAADIDDKHGYFPIATVVANMQGRGYLLASQNISFESALMRVYLAEKALKICLKGINDWDTEVASIMNARCGSWGGDNDANSRLRTFSDRALTAFVKSEVAFHWIDSNKEDLMQDLPLFLAAIHIAGDCALASARIFYRSAGPSNYNDVKTEKFVRYSVEEKDIVYETLSSIQELADSLRAECGRRSVISFPHLRRAKEHLTRLTKFIEGIKGKSSKDKRQKRRAQGSLDVFFRSSQDEFSPSPLE